MSVFDDYFATITPGQKAELERIRAIVHKTVPDVVEGLSYGMPAYLYKGKGVLSAMVTKKFLSIYPYSGKVADTLKAKLKDYECTPGSIHYSEEKPMPEALIVDILHARMAEIDAKEKK